MRPERREAGEPQGQAPLLRAGVHATLPLVEASRAHSRLAARETFGKVVLVPA